MKFTFVKNGQRITGWARRSKRSIEDYRKVVLSTLANEFGMMYVPFWGVIVDPELF